MNGFKEINDAYGHLAGDELLKQFATELRHSFRAADAVARMGGDEFVCLVDGSVEDAQGRVDQIRKWVNGHYTLSTEAGKRKVPIDSSVGFAVWEPGVAPEQILRAADAAMYEDKKRTAAAKPPSEPGRAPTQREPRP